ncbi:hypothetical protein BH09BAC3_BH09BAC3_09180 [soil metagenome]
MKPTITQEPPVKAKPFVDMEVLASIHPELLNDAYMYVHCHFENSDQDMLIRIWKSTFLIDRSSASRAELVHAENITYAPQWTLVPDHQPFSFLLIFSRLPKSCMTFDLLEDIPQRGGFFVKDIGRNESDVYHVSLI